MSNKSRCPKCGALPGKCKCHKVDKYDIINLAVKATLIAFDNLVAAKKIATTVQNIAYFGFTLVRDKYIEDRIRGIQWDALRQLHEKESEGKEQARQEYHNNIKNGMSQVTAQEIYNYSLKEITVMTSLVKAGFNSIDRAFSAADADGYIVAKTGAAILKTLQNRIKSLGNSRVNSYKALSRQTQIILGDASTLIQNHDNLYYFNIGDGKKIIYDDKGFDTLIFGERIELSDLVVKISGNDLIIAVKPYGIETDEFSDQITIIDFMLESKYMIERYEFSSGQVITADELIGLIKDSHSDSCCSHHLEDTNFHPAAFPILGAALLAFTIYDMSKAVLALINKKCECGPECNAPQEPPMVHDPLAFDLNNDGKISTINVYDSKVYVDVNSNGFSKRIGWIAPEDGLLFHDTNGNGQFDGMHELFGNNNMNGFEHLSEYDLNKDRIINKDDEIYSNLQVWQDRNSNGLVDEGELISLEQLGIDSINLDHKKEDKNDNDNKINSSGSYIKDGVIHYMGSLDLAYKSSGVSRYVGDIEIDEEAKNLPKLHGFGDMAMSQYAYTIYEDFKKYADNLINGEEFTNISIERFLYYWSGLNKVHEKYGIQRKGELTIEDKIWIIEKSIGQYQYTKGIESIYELGRKTWSGVLDTRQNNELFNNLNTYYSDRIIALIFERKGIPGIKYNFEKDYVSLDAKKLSEYINANASLDKNFLHFAYVLTQTSYIDREIFHLLFNDEDLESFFDRQILYGSSKDDNIIVSDNSSIIMGGQGKDHIEGGTGDDIYMFYRGDGEDTIVDSGGNDRIVFGEGITKDDLLLRSHFGTVIIAIKEEGKSFEELTDVIYIKNFLYYNDYHQGSIEILEFADGSKLDISYLKDPHGTDGDDGIYWGNTPLNIDLGDGDDTLYAGDHDNTIRGGKGNDYIESGIGDDTYLFNRGDGQDTISDRGGNDRIVFGEGITKNDLIIKFDYNTITIGLREEGKSFKELSDKVTMNNFISDGRLLSNSNRHVEFSDGSKLNLADIINLSGSDEDDSVIWLDNPVDIDLGDGNDFLKVGDHDNIIRGGKGNDTIVGGIGNDTYIFNRGDGQDTIIEQGGNDRIVFGEGITKDDIVVVKDGYDLIIAIKEKGNPFSELTDKITIEYFNYYKSELSQRVIETLEFADGSKLGITEYMNLQATEGSDYIVWVDTPLDINLGDGDDTLYAGDDGNTIRGGKGNDYIESGCGNDTYIFDRGDGHDNIWDSGGIDRIVFGEGITKDDIIVVRDGDDLTIGIKEKGKLFSELTDKITIKLFSTHGRQSQWVAFETLEFADGSKLDIAQYMNLQGSDENNHIEWTSTPLDIDLGGGDDTLYAGDHGNTIRGGKGNDYIESGTGDDTYLFNRGDGQDTIIDRGGNDRIVFGKGITRDDIIIRKTNDSLIIAIKEKGRPFSELTDKITILNPDRNYYGQHQEVIEVLEFEDGSKLSYSDLTNLQGTNEDDHISSVDTPLDIDLGDGDDDLTAGDHGNIIRGGKGNDIIRSGTGNDTYIFNRGDGRDRIYDEGGNDRIVFGEGITKDDLIVSSLYGYITIGLREEGKSFEELSDTIDIHGFISDGHTGGGAIEFIEFADGSKLDIAELVNLLGSDEQDDFIEWYDTPLDIDLGDGNDTLRAGDHGNIIRGGKGKDLIHSGTGDDTYIFNRGDGEDTIVDSGGNNRIVFGEGITKDDIVILESYNKLTIKIKEKGKSFSELTDKINIINPHMVYGNKIHNIAIKTIEFSDGSSLNYTDLMNLLPTENSDSIYWVYSPLDIDLGGGDDTLYAGDYGNTIRGGKGNDLIHSGTGDDTYIFNRGDGQDTIYDKGGNDRIVFGEGITKDDIAIMKSGNKLIIGIIEKGKSFVELTDKITVVNLVEFTDSEYEKAVIETFEFADGSKLDSADYMNLQYIDFMKPRGTDGNDFIEWYDTPLNIDLGDGNDKLFAGNHGNTIRGGKGNDYIESGSGDDTYIFNRGDGQDTIFDSGGSNRIVFGEGITKDDIIIKAVDFEVSIGIREKGKSFSELADKITFENFYNEYDNKIYDVVIESLEFADGTKLDINDFMNLQSSEGHDSISWIYTPLDIDLGDGDDGLTAGDYGNIIRCGKGEDYVESGSGDDTYIFYRGDGQDTIYDSGGKDTIKLYGIERSEFALHAYGGELTISYGDGDLIVFNGNLERIEREDGSYLTESNINYIIQEITSFCEDKGISFYNAEDVQQNDYLNNLISAQWNTL